MWSKGGRRANWVALLLLVGAVAKSAQIPLHTWLPDAMEGPTPVSALIHAATMVTAGVYLVAAHHVLFENAPDIQDLVALLGVATLLMAGVIALVQTDIKRIIAYSTMSQIGYMFTAVGVGAYAAGMFHLLTHAFFKALLFLGAGIVIHALANEQDVRRMGGLAKALPNTTKLMWVGTIALIGFFPFSKDEILAAALKRVDHGLDRVGRRPCRRVPDRHLRDPADAARVLRRDVRLRQGAHPHRPRRGAVDDVLARCGARRRGAARPASSLSGSGSPTSSGTSSPDRADIEPTVAEDVITTLIAWALGLGGGLLAWRPYAAPGRAAALRAASARGDGGREQVLLGRAVRRDRLPAGGVPAPVWANRVVEGWIIGGSVTATAFVRRHRRRRVADAQTGVVREYAVGVVLRRADRRRLPPGEGEPVTTALILLPLVAALVVGLAPLDRRRPRGWRWLAALAEVALGAVALVVRHPRRHPVRHRQGLDHRLPRHRRRPLPRRHGRPLAVHGAAGAVGIAAAAAAASWPAATGRAPTSRCCCCWSARWCCSSPPRTCALLRRLGGDDDPALRADRRLGRRPAAAGDAHVLHLHADRLAADAGRRRLGGHPRQHLPARRR